MRVFILLVLITTLQINLGAQQKIFRDGFSMQYPDDWKLDTEDEDYDPDALFSIDSPDNENMIMFVIFDMQVDTTEVMKQQVAAFTQQLLKKPEISYFSTWGKYKGSGTMLKGKLMGLFKGTVRIFVYGDSKRTLTVVEQFYDKSAGELKKDYDLMSSSFKFN